MNPDWKDAPEWAQWLAMDEDGSWFWYQYEPVPGVECFTRNGGRMLPATLMPAWYETLEPRP